MTTNILTASEAAELLRIDRQRLYQLVREKQIPVIRIGRRQYRFSKPKLDAWIERGGNIKGGEENEPQ